MANKVLIIATSYNQALGDTGPTGSWVEEVASPYFFWRIKGFHVDIASIKGGEIPFDPASKSGDFLTHEADAFLKNDEAKAAVTQSKALSQVVKDGLDQYDAVFVPGGHGIVFDGPDNSDLKKVLEEMWAKGKVVSAVCHGSAGLVSACDANGDSIIKGRRVTGFTNSEEKAVGKDTLVPFSTEDRLKELGGDFEGADDWASHCIRDGNLVTGQNPQSSKAVAEAVAELLAPGIEPQHGKGPGAGLHHRATHFTREDHHDHSAEQPLGQGTRRDTPTHPQAHMSEWHQPVRQTTHTGPGQGGRHSEHPDRSYTAN